MGYIDFVLHLIVCVVCASTFWKAAALEETNANAPSPLIWSMGSLAVFLVTWLVLGFGWPGIILSQVGLGIAIGVVRTIVFLRNTPR